MTDLLLPTATRRETLHEARRIVRGQRTGTALALAVLLGASLASLTVPPLLGRIVDVVDERRDADALTTPLVLLVVAIVVQGVLTGLALPLVARVGERGLARLREEVVERALQIPLAQVEAGGTGDLVARVGGDTDTVSEAVREGVPVLFVSALTVALTVVGLAFLDPRLALAGLVVVPVHVFAVRFYARRSGPLYAAERRAEGVRAQQVVDTLRGARTVTALLLGPRHVARVASASEAAIDRTMQATRTRNSFFSRLNGAEFLGLSSILLMGTLLVREDAVTLGQATAAALYFLRLFDPINVLLYLLDEVQKAAAALSRLVGVAQLPAPPPGSGALPSGPTAQLRGIRFAYDDGPPVLHDLDLDLAAGELVAVVGASGAGKSTLALLLAGVHAPDAGEVRLGGVRLAELGEAELRRTVCLVTQEVHVFSGSLAEDLRLAHADATEADLLAALDLVGAGDWARALPDGLATEVGAHGEALSAVQAQQLALARLVLADPRIAVLDEATADAGSAGARVLEKAATAALRGRTALVVAHRLSTAAAADRVVVVDAGRVVEQGSPAELVDAGGAYARLWEAWATSR